MERDKQTMSWDKPVNSTEQRVSICQGLFSCYTDGTFCDVSLSTNNGQPDAPPDIIQCHKLVLSSTSEFFSQQLISDAFKPDSNVIDVSPVKLGVLKEVLRYMYTGMCSITEQNVTSLLQASVKWNLVNLVEDCNMTIEEMMSVTNAAHFMQQAYVLKQDKLASLCGEFIRGHLADVMKSPEMNALDIAIMEDILSSNQINVAYEDSIFQTVVNYLEANPDVDDPGRLIKLIRFDQISKTYLCEAVLPHPLIRLHSQEEYVSSAQKSRLDAEISRPATARPRYWGRYKYVMVNRNQRVVTFNEETKSWQEHFNNGRFPWKLQESTTCSSQECVFVAGSSKLRDSAKVSVIGIANNIQYLNTHQPVLPDLPHGIHGCGMVCDGKRLYVVYGTDPHRNAYTNTMMYVDLTSLARGWRTLCRLPYVNSSPIVVMVSRCIHAIGGVWYKRHHYRYAVNTNKWEIKAAVPQKCNAQTGGGVVVDDKVHIYTPTHCMTYSEKDEQWTTLSYNPIGISVKPVVYDGKIVACVQRTDKRFVLMSHDRKRNKWKMEDVDVSRCLSTQHFHVLERP